MATERRSTVGGNDGVRNFCFLPNIALLSTKSLPLVKVMYPHIVALKQKASGNIQQQKKKQSPSCDSIHTENIIKMKF
jgi:hypothetical protein